MTNKIGIIFAGLTILWLWLVVALKERNMEGMWQMVFILWPSFATITAIYWFPAHINVGKMLGKNVQTGNLSLFSYLFFGSYLWAAFTYWWVRHIHLVKSICSHLNKNGHYENIHDQIIPNLYLGRRCNLSELPCISSFMSAKKQSAATSYMVVDLTAEFSESKGIVEHLSRYICLPVLDTRIPPLDEFISVAQQVAEFIRHERGVVYIHCANGHGRSAALVAAVLLLLGYSKTTSEVQSFLQTRRPSVKLHGIQRQLIEQFISLTENK